MKIISILAAVTWLTLALPTKAQSQESQWYGAVSYNMAVPFGQASDFGGGFSPLGFGMDFRYFFKPQWSLGLASGWQVFDKKATSTTQLDNVAVNGTQHRYLNSVPILVGGHYYIQSGVPEWLIPFAGLNVGTYWAERRIDVGMFSVNDSAWHMGLAPDLGVAFHTGNTLTLLSFRYNYLFGAGGSDDLPYFTISVGAAWK